jgi:hypothetical protein
MVGEAGREAMVPLDNKKMMSEFRGSLGMGNMSEDLSQMKDAIVSELRNQNTVMPNAMASAYGQRLASDPRMHRNLDTANERLARTENLRGGW